MKSEACLISLCSRLRLTHLLGLLDLIHHEGCSRIRLIHGISISVLRWRIDANLHNGCRILLCEVAIREVEESLDVVDALSIELDLWSELRKGFFLQSE